MCVCYYFSVKSDDIKAETDAVNTRDLTIRSIAVHSSAALCRNDSAFERPEGSFIHLRV